MKTYINQQYGFSKPYRDELNKMNTTLTKTESFGKNEINKLYNTELTRLNNLKNEVSKIGNEKVGNAGIQNNQTRNMNSMQNNTIAKNTFRGLGGKLSESSNLSLLNTAQNVSTQAMSTTASALREIDNDIARAKATRDIDLANASKSKFDLIYDNFFKVNEMYVKNKELLQELED